MHEPVPYKEAYPIGTHVCIANREMLEEFKATWQYHHKLVPEQMDHAGELTTVAEVGFYHGGDPLYALLGVPGLWHEQCLLAAGEGNQ